MGDWLENKLDDVLNTPLKQRTPAIREALRAAKNEGLEEAERIAHEQRCERGTEWDKACLAIAAAIRARKQP